MYRPMLFSAAHSAALVEQARRDEAQARERPKVLWKRGFHSEGGRAGWGYYLEPAPPSDTASTVDDEGESREGSAAGDDGEDSGHERPRTGRHGTRRRRRGSVGHAETDGRREKETRDADSPTCTRAKVIASHGHRIARNIAQRARMAVKTRTIVSLWFALTVPVIFWDASYCFLRPRSMVGGDLHWIWKPYAIYQEVDYVYGVKAYQNGDGFTNAQSALNVVENFLNIFYLYLAHVSGSPVAPLVGFASAVMTLSKTVLYWLQEYYCGGCAVGHNDLKTLFVYWIIPNGLWLIVPSYIIWQLGKDITSALRVAGRAQKTKKQ